MTEQQQATTPPPEPQRAPRGRMPSGFATLRDVVTFVSGLGFIANEVFIAKTAEPVIIGVGVTMMGLPLVFGADERKRGGGGEEK